MKNHYARESDTVPTAQEAHLALRQAALELGLRIPTTPDEIEVFERSLDLSKLPKISDEDAMAFFRGEIELKDSTVDTSVSAEFYEELAMAARFGGEIPPEVKALMESDRAEEELKQKKDGSDA